jgi:hypothetical protein
MTETQPITIRVWDNSGGSIVSWAVPIDQIVFYGGPLYSGPPIIPQPLYSVPNLETMMRLAGTATGSAPVPEPNTLALIALTAASVSAVRLRRHSRTGT